MENLEIYKNRIKSIEELSNRLDSGELSIDELVKLETLTRELYERTVILKYKAFENKVNPITKTPQILETIVPEAKEEVVNSIEEVESEPTIDFSIFDAPEETVKLNFEETPMETVENEPVFAQMEEEIKVIENVQVDELEEEKDHVQEERIEVATTEIHSSSQGQSFWEQLNITNNSLSTQFEGAKIDTLVGAFGLNEKLRFINELFDGSSESFSEAIKVLDTQSDLDTAKIKSSELAVKHGWDAEEESVVDFMMMVNRRYA